MADLRSIPALDTLRSYPLVIFYYKIHIESVPTCVHAC